MKTLLLMRHGKADWKDVKKDEDKFRPLTKKGMKDIKTMIELLEDKEIFPEMIITSTAKRARDTASMLLAQCCGEITLQAVDALYMAEPVDIIDSLTVVDDRINLLMVIGHNPGLEGLLQHLTGKVESLSTSNIACLHLPIEHWSQISLETLAEKWEKWKPKDA